MPDHCGPGRGNEPPRLGKDGADPRPLVKGKGKEIGLEAPSSIIAGLESWLCRQPELVDRCHIVDVAVPKTGFSADTFLIDLEGCATGVVGKRALVVRIDRPGRNNFLGTSIVKQARMMQRSEVRSGGKECVRICRT